MPWGKTPSATYRTQFSLNFRFADARDLVPYLHDLGVSDLYASPRFKARKGSSHGYDVTDPQRINSELGTEREFEEMVARLKDYGMGLILDIVPNHMAASVENPWWIDVLENGASSPYAHFFAIDWNSPDGKAGEGQSSKIILPVLGDLYGRVLENQEFHLRIDELGFCVRYGETRFPLDPKTWRPLLDAGLAALRETSGGSESVTRAAELSGRVDRLPHREVADPGIVASRRAQQAEIRDQLWKLVREDEAFRRALEKVLHEFNGSRGEPASFDRLDRLLGAQAFRLAYWRVAAEEINYRRFFDINDLVGLRVELADVFEARHATILKLVEEEKIAGLRVDHVDGLYDPRAYLDRLVCSCAQAAARSAHPPAERFYVAVEKILGPNEPLPEDWPVAGTTGYDFLNAVTGVVVDSSKLPALEATYAKFTGQEESFAEVSIRGNRLAIDHLFTGELRQLGRDLRYLAARDRYARDVPLSALLGALAELTACLPVYRTYTAGESVSPCDRSYIERAIDAARGRGAADPFLETALEFLRRVLLLDPADLPQPERDERLRFIGQWQQFSGPVMAKGLEDTAAYLHNSFLSLNEVGGDPVRAEPPLDVAGFHQFLQQRLARSPLTLNATSTHDTKRGEDVRARIDVLSELATEWDEHLSRWARWNRSKKAQVPGREPPAPLEPGWGEHLFRWAPWSRSKKAEVSGQKSPAPLEEVFLYQTMLGAWPMRSEEVPAFRDRLTACLIKAAREAKLYTSWIDPQPQHEEALASFIARILDESEENRFLKDFLRFQKRVAFHGALNALSQVLLKIASPGVPDFYQGSEMWDLNLMDPDNRRPVDFAGHARLLSELAGAERDDREALLERLVAEWPDGCIKLYLTRKALEFRRTHNSLFLQGEYLPLNATGKRAENLCAFARRQGDSWAVVAVPRRTTTLVDRGRMPLGHEAWGSSALRLPDDAPRRWRNLFTEESLQAGSTRHKRWLSLESVFRRFPVALLDPAGS